MKGIYKITSPSGKVYIGQSVNIKDRWRRYKSRGAKSQHSLQRSFNKYGVNAHVFDVIHELPKDSEQDVLNEYEKLYIYLYKNCDIILLNIKDGGGGGGKMPDSVKQKIGKANKGRKPSPQTIAASVAVSKGKSTWNKGKKYKLNLNEDQIKIKKENAKNRIFKHTKETKEKMSSDRKGKPQPKLKGKKLTMGHRIKLSESHHKNKPKYLPLF